MTIAGEDFHLALIEMDLDPVAIAFDFVNPLVSRRRPELECGELGRDELRERSGPCPRRDRETRQAATRGFPRRR